MLILIICFLSWYYDYIYNRWILNLQILYFDVIKIPHIRLYQDVLMIRPRLYLFNTNTGRWHQLQNYLLWNDLLKAKPKRRVHGGVWGFAGIKLSNVGDSYLWNITSDIFTNQPVDILLPGLENPMNHFLMCYQLIEKKGFIILDNELATGHANIW